ncbi:MAG: hypothetical protein GYA34_16285 [Chloroflexi bacterium]|nr:hypothetical protein [Chloroflexota bacterium]
MKKQLSIRDWQVLSAYLDDNLSLQEKTRLESKLSTDADMREALEGLRRTRLLLRNSPQLKAPRNFTLTSRMVGLKKQDRASRFFPLLKFSTVVASILFVFALLGDFVFKQTPQMAAIQQREAIVTQESAEAEFTEAEGPAAQHEVPMMPAATIPPTLEMMDAEEAAGKEPSPLSNAPIEPLPSTMPSLMKIAPTATVVEMPQLAAAPEESYPLPPESYSKDFGGMGAGMEDTTSDVGEQTVEEYDTAKENNLQAPVYSVTEEAEPQAAYPKVNVWRILEIIFGGLIVISGVLTFILKSKKTS